MLILCRIFRHYYWRIWIRNRWNELHGFIFAFFTVHETYKIVFFLSVTVSAYSSGTGGAGVVGSFAYAALTEPHLADLSPKAALLIMLIVPLVFALT